MTRRIILYREGDMNAAELAAAKQYFICTPTRMDIRKDDLVIGRYSVLPFYKEQERDVRYVGAELINTFRQHNFVADLWNWYDLIKDHTPETWRRLEDLPDNTQFVLKGKTNSKKFEWDTDMFAKDKAAAGIVYSRLTADYMIGNQDIYIRRYVPLKTYMIGIKGLPVTKEFRFFVLNGNIISGAYYWSSHVDDFKELGLTIPDVMEVPRDWLQGIIDTIGNSISFYAIDVAQTESSQWIVIELNDGQMSGLSENNPETLYMGMALRLSDAFK